MPRILALKSAFLTRGQYSFGPYAIDAKNKMLVVGPSDFTHEENMGLYSITFSGLKTKNLVLQELAWYPPDMGATKR